jgi:hypothetical protein
LHAAERRALGQVFTPPALANRLAELLDVAAIDGVVLDPACGDGALLVAVAEVRRRAGWPVGRILAGMEGWDRDPEALAGARRALGAWAEAHGASVPPTLHACDALSADGRPGEVLARGGIAAVIANPPYLEAKRMKLVPGLRDRLRADFPELDGAYDLYLAFAVRALALACGGPVALLVPGKILQARYAAGWRAASASRVRALLDLTRMEPRPFAGTGVYPVMLVLGDGGGTRVAHGFTPADVDAPAWRALDPADWAAVGPEGPWFVPFDTWDALRPTLALPRLGSVARFASACSFHAPGLRERFVGADRPDGDAFPYLGGPSRTRQSEVETFRTRWAGWWIRYDQDALRALGNPLPPIGNFMRPKVVVAQHATRVRAVADWDGRWVTKDTYPVGWPVDPRWTVGALTAVLSSTVFTALYNTLFQGVLVGGETYHVLPAFLHQVPVPLDVPDVEAEVRALHAEGPVDGRLWDAVDRRIAAAYGVGERDRQRMIAVHLERVGAERPALCPEVWTVDT